MSRKAIVLGGGITGLTAAWKLAENGYDTLVVEKEEQLGGQARTIRFKDYYLDLGAHKIFTVMEHAQTILEELAGGDLLKRPKFGRIRYGKTYLPFPVGVKDMLQHVALPKLAWMTASLVQSRLTGGMARKSSTSYEAWFIANYGRAIYETFVKEPTEKIWGVASTLSADLANRRVTQASLLENLKRIFLRQKIDRVTKADHFFYPKYGCQVFVDRLAERTTQANGRILNKTSVDKIETSNGRACAVRLSNGETIALNEHDVVISTIPKQYLLDALDQHVPGEVDYALQMLRERNLLLVYIMLDQDKLMDDNWIFFPERTFLFTRISEMKNCSPYMAPEGKTFLCCEMTCHSDQTFSPQGLEYIIDHMIGSLHQAGIIDRAKVCDRTSVFLEHAYPLWDLSYKQNLDKVLSYLDAFGNLYSVGRQGGFVYGGIADCLDIGLVTAKFVCEGRDRSQWPAERRKFDDYTVVD